MRTCFDKTLPLPSLPPRLPLSPTTTRCLSINKPSSVCASSPRTRPPCLLLTLKHLDVAPHASPPPSSRRSALRSKRPKEIEAIPEEEEANENEKPGGRRRADSVKVRKTKRLSIGTPRKVRARSVTETCYSRLQNKVTFVDTPLRTYRYHAIPKVPSMSEAGGHQQKEEGGNTSWGIFRYIAGAAADRFARRESQNISSRVFKDAREELGEDEEEGEGEEYASRHVHEGQREEDRGVEVRDSRRPTPFASLEDADIPGPTTPTYSKSREVKPSTRRSSPAHSSGHSTPRLLSQKSSTSALHQFPSTEHGQEEEPAEDSRGRAASAIEFARAAKSLGRQIESAKSFQRNFKRGFVHAFHFTIASDARRVLKFPMSRHPVSVDALHLQLSDRDDIPGMLPSSPLVECLAAACGSLLEPESALDDKEDDLAGFVKPPTCWETSVPLPSYTLKSIKEQAELVMSYFADEGDIVSADIFNEKLEAKRIVEWERQTSSAIGGSSMELQKLSTGSRLARLMEDELHDPFKPQFVPPAPATEAADDAAAKKKKKKQQDGDVLWDCVIGPDNERIPLCEINVEELLDWCGMVVRCFAEGITVVRVTASGRCVLRRVRFALADGSDITQVPQDGDGLAVALLQKNPFDLQFGISGTLKEHMVHLSRVRGIKAGYGAPNFKRLLDKVSIGSLVVPMSLCLTVWLRHKRHAVSLIFSSEELRNEFSFLLRLLAIPSLELTYLCEKEVIRLTQLEKQRQEGEGGGGGGVGGGVEPAPSATPRVTAEGHEMVG